MSENVIILGNITTLDIDPDRILKSAIGKMESVILSGFDKDGELVFASSVADGGDALWLVEKFKQSLMNVGE